MSRPRIGSRSSHVGAAALSLALFVAAPAAARAQGAGNGFLLGTPVGSLTIRGGYDHANAGSDIFNDPQTIGQLTLKKSDFSSPSAMAAGRGGFGYGMAPDHCSARLTTAVTTGKL